MNISETARLSGLSSEMIRDYERLGLIPPAERSEAGYRQYSARDLDTLTCSNTRARWIFRSPKSKPCSN